MPDASSTSLFLHLKASRQLTFALGALHLGAVGCAFANDLPVIVQLVIVLAVALSAFHCISLHGSCRAARAIVLLAWDREGQWRLVQRDGRVLEVWLEHGAYSHPLLVALPFRTRGRRRPCVLVVPDRVDADQMRQLRVRLRCASAASTRGDDSGAVC